MNRLKRLLIWLVRCRHSRGFGIQSPWAYQFVRYTINEHYPYYSYEDLMKSVPALDSEKRKIYELYFRLVNYRQPNEILYSGDDLERFGAYCHHGCRKSKVISAEEKLQGESQILEILFLSSSHDARDICLKALEYVDSGSIIVVENIYSNRGMRHFWKELIDDERTGVIFDLYYCGIIFFDKKRYKEKYIINF